MPIKGNKSNLSLKMFEDIKAGEANKEKLFEEYGPTYGRMYRAVDHCISLVKKPKIYERENRPTNVVWFGTAGSGKTYAAEQEAIDAKKSMWIATADQIKSGWYDGYAGEEIVFIDDFRGEIMKPHEFLNLLDNKNKRRPIKGGFVDFSPKQIYITSPDHPVNWWPNWYDRTDNNWAQVKRRLDKVIRVDKMMQEQIPVEDSYLYKTITLQNM